MKQQTEARRKEISQRLDQLKIQQSEREKKFNEEKKRMAELKAKKKLFEEAEKKQK